MDDSAGTAGPRWGVSPTVKAKTAVQRSVTALLDELAPERVLKRVEQLTGPVEQHRTPTGCVLQAPQAAVSVSWFGDSADDAVLGELRVITWRGIVQRRGAPPARKGATIVSELTLHPLQPPEGECLWQATDGTQYDTAALAAKCLALLQEQVGSHA